MRCLFPVPMPNVVYVNIGHCYAAVIPIRLTADQMTILGALDQFEGAGVFGDEVFRRICSHIMNDVNAPKFIGQEIVGMCLLHSTNEWGMIISFRGQPERLMPLEVLDITDVPTGVPPIVRN